MSKFITNPANENEILSIEDCRDEIDRLNQELRKKQKIINEVMNLIKKYGKYDGEKCTQGFQMWSADFNKILDILNEVSDEQKNKENFERFRIV